MDLILLASWKDGFAYVRGIKVSYKRGDVVMGERELAHRWKWSRGKVGRFINDLEREQMLSKKQYHKRNENGAINETTNEPQNSNVKTLLSIVNYEKYQAQKATDRATDRATDGTEIEPQTGRRRAAEATQPIESLQEKEAEEGKEEVSKKEEESKKDLLAEIQKNTPEKKSTRRKGTLLPDDWQPPPEAVAYAQGEGLRDVEIDTLKETFLNYYTNGRGKNDAHTNWLRTWQNWVRKEATSCRRNYKPSGFTATPSATDRARDRQDEMLAATIAAVKARSY
jgi:hypothetical protein